MNSIVIVIASYIAAQMLSDIGSLQIVQFLGFSLDAGTFIYPITFTLRDLAHKTLGVRGVRVVIFSAAVINVVMAGYFFFVAQLSPDTTAGSSDLWGKVLSPVWRITLASIIAELISELTDTEIYRIWVEKVTKKYQWLRVLVSNAVSVPLDTLVFVFLAFYGTMPMTAIWSIVLGNIILKGLVTVVSMPLIYSVPDQKTGS